RSTDLQFGEVTILNTSVALPQKETPSNSDKEDCNSGLPFVQPTKKRRAPTRRKSAVFIT
ncbi:MAG: hypothetical protein AB7O96_18655, partial [Pseudobdellovibrionaceae bacterium]